jgi:hypothetical protein
MPMVASSAGNRGLRQTREPQVQPLVTGFTFGRAGFIRQRDHFTEMAINARAMRIKCGEKFRPAGEAHAERQTQTADVITGQGLRLRIIHRLQTVLGAAQEVVGSGQFVARFRRQDAELDQRLQHRQQRALLQALVHAAAYQLERLGDEFHFANAAGAELDVVLHALAFHFAGDHAFHFAQGFEGGEIDVTPVHEWPQRGDQALAGGNVTAAYTRLDHRVALPRPALCFVVGLHCVEAAGERAAVAPGAQAHVNTEHEAVSGVGVQHLDQAAAEAREEFVIRQFAFCRTRAALHLAFFRIGEDEVDVRGEVQLASAEFAHAEHNEFLRLAGLLANRHTELCLAPVGEFFQRERNAGVGECGKVGNRFLQRGAAARSRQITRTISRLRSRRSAAISVSSSVQAVSTARKRASISPGGRARTNSSPPSSEARTSGLRAHCPAQNHCLQTRAANPATQQKPTPARSAGALGVIFPVGSQCVVQRNGKAASA